jgi:hypothetical protein
MNQNPRRNRQESGHNGLDSGRADETSPFAVSSTPPRFSNTEGLSLDQDIGAHSHGFSIRRLRFASGVAAPAQDWLPAAGLRLCREGVEPSRSLRKVSGHIAIPLSGSYPVAMESCNP